MSVFLVRLPIVLLLLLLFDGSLSLARFITGIGVVLFPEGYKAGHWLYQ